MKGIKMKIDVKWKEWMKGKKQRSMQTVESTDDNHWSNTQITFANKQTTNGVYIAHTHTSNTYSTYFKQQSFDERRIKI